MFENTKKYRLMKGPSVLVAGTIFTRFDNDGDPDYEATVGNQNRWIKLKPWVVEERPERFKPLTFEMDGEEHHSCRTAASNSLTIGEVSILEEPAAAYEKARSAVYLKTRERSKNRDVDLETGFETNARHA